MTPDEYVQQIAQRLHADGSAVSTISLPGGPALVGYQSKFRLRWFATKLHLFTVAVSVPHLTPEVFDSVIGQAVAYAKHAKGALRGLQSGVAVIPIVVAAEVDPAARAVAEARPKRIFAVPLVPVIVDLKSAETFRYRGHIWLGVIYNGWLRQRLQAALPRLPTLAS
jgi:hypothetical protein